MTEPDHKQELQRLHEKADDLLLQIERRLCGAADLLLIEIGSSIGTVRSVLRDLLGHADAMPQSSEPPTDLFDRLAAARKRVGWAENHFLVSNDLRGHRVAAIARYEPESDLVRVTTPEGWQKTAPRVGVDERVLAGTLHRELLREHEGDADASP